MEADNRGVRSPVIVRIGKRMRPLCAAMMIVCVLVGSLAAQAPTSQLSAMLTAGPHTTVDGTRVVDRMTVFPGDSIETHEQLPADLVVKGTTLRVLGKSQVEFHDTWAELRSGGASVTTTTAFQLKSKCFSAEPASVKNTRFTVTPETGRILVTAEEGDVLLHTRKELRIPVGKTAAITSCGLPQENTSLINGKSHLKYILGGVAAGGGAAAIMPMMSSGCKEKVSAGAPDDCQN
jgi:hypothetical protein